MSNERGQSQLWIPLIILIGSVLAIAADVTMNTTSSTITGKFLEMPKSIEKSFQIEVWANTTIKLENIESLVRATLSLDNGTLLENQKIDFYLNDKPIGYGLTNTEGFVDFNVSNGKIKAVFNGSSFINPSESMMEMTGQENVTFNESNINETKTSKEILSEGLEQGEAEIGKPVRWTKKIKKDLIFDIKSQIPKEAFNAKINEINEEFIIEYYTDAPKVSEETIDESTKIVTVSPDFDYKNIKVHTNITESKKDAIKLYLKGDSCGRGTDVTNDQFVNLTFVDTNGNDLIDRLEWTADSNQTFEVSIEVLNVYTYVRNGENWTVAFNTVGTADLVINSTNAEWTELLTDVALTKDEMNFLGITCGEKSMKSSLKIIDENGLTYDYSNLTVFDSVKAKKFLMENYSCEETGYLTNNMLIAGYAALQFTFGDKVAWAYDATTFTVTCNALADAICRCNNTPAKSCDDMQALCINASDTCALQGTNCCGAAYQCPANRTHANYTSDTCSINYDTGTTTCCTGASGHCQAGTCNCQIAGSCTYTCEAGWETCDTDDTNTNGCECNVGGDHCQGSCPSTSCKWNETYCSGSTCSNTLYNPDDVQTYCDGCIGAGKWNLGGSSSGTGCCGDDTWDKVVTCIDSSANGDCGANTQACCDETESCVNGTDTCTVSSNCEYFGGSLKSYCSSGQWEDPDESSGYCTASGCSYSFNIGGEVAAAACCGDDGSGENARTETGTSDAPADFKESETTCCDTSSDCNYGEDDTCTASGSSKGTIPNKAYCSSGTWNGGDDGSTQCSSIAGASRWQIYGETSGASTGCCGDDNSENRIVETTSTDSPSPYNNNGVGETCCDTSTDCSETGTDTCTASSSSAGSVPNRAYCSSGTWYGGDVGSTQCDSIVGSGKYFSNLGTITGSGYYCCNDDTTSDDFATYSGSLTSSTSLSCRRCNDGSDSGTSTLYGNGYASGTTCYYGDIACSSGSGSNGATCTLACSGVGTTCCPSQGTYNDSIACNDGSCASTIHNRDDAQSYCTATSSGCTAYNWNSTSREYESGAPSCCGDDASEVRTNRTCKTGVCTSDSTDWCCGSAQERCADDGQCYSNNELHDVNDDGWNEICKASSPGEWDDGAAPRYSKNSTNTTVAGYVANFSLEWNDSIALQGGGGYIFSTNNSGTWINASWYAFSSTPQNVSNATVLNSTVGTVVAWCYYANDSVSNWNGTNCQSGNQFIITTTETTPPQWITGSNATNTTVAGVPCNFTLNWNDNYQLAGYIFSTNNSGTWKNSSYISGFSGTSNTSWNVTTLNTTVGIIIVWCYYANDTSNNWNGTNCQSGNQFIITTTDVTPPTYTNNASQTVSVYTPTDYSNFSITWNDNSNGLSGAYLENNFSGAMFVNTSMTGPYPIYMYNSTSLPARAYRFRFVANDSSGNNNATEWVNFAIAKVDTNISLYLNGSETNNTYVLNSVANFTAKVNVTGLTVYLTSNYTGWVEQSNPTSIINYTTLNTLGKFWNMTGYFVGNENYSSFSRTLWFNVTDATPPTYSLNSTNSTTAGTPVKHNLYWTDNVNLSGYIFQFCNGTWNSTQTSGGVYSNIWISNYSDGWKYNDSNVWPGGDWFNTAYDDSGWSSGTARFGYLETGWQNTTLLAATSYYFRKAFTVSDTTEVINMSFDIDFDDSYAVYLNGYEINRSATMVGVNTSDHAATSTAHNWMCDNGVGFPTCGSGSDPVFPNIPLNSTHLGYLVNGTNYIAVLVKSGGGSGDTMLMLQMQGFINNTTMGSCNGGWVNDTWNNTGFTGTSAWSNVTKTINSTGGANIAWCVYANDTSNNWNGTSCSNPFTYNTPVETGNFNLTVYNSTYQASGAVIKIYKNSVLVASGIGNISQNLDLNENYTIEITKNMSTLNLTARIEDLNITQNFNIDSQIIDNYTYYTSSTISNLTSVFALNTTGLSYSYANLTIPKNGNVNKILHCTNWNFTLGNCSSWQINKTSDYQFSDLTDYITFNVTSFTGYAGGAGYNSNLTIWDETDVGMPYGDKTKYTYNNVKSFANYTNSTSGEQINTTNDYCKISFNVSSDWTAWVNMTYNSASLLYENVTQFSSAGTYNWNVSCLSLNYDNLNTSDTVVINTDSASPTYSNNQTNTTAAGVPCNFTLNWNDNYQLAGYIFSTNNSGTWINGSYVTSFAGTSNTSWNVTTLNTTVGIKVSWCFYANDSYGNMNASSCSNPNTFIITTTDYPKYWGNSTNSTRGGTPVNFELKWNDTDGSGLYGYILSVDNCTGSFVNQSLKLFGRPYKNQYKDDAGPVSNPEYAYDNLLNDSSTVARINITELLFVSYINYTFKASNTSNPKLFYRWANQTVGWVGLYVPELKVLNYTSGAWKIIDNTVGDWSGNLVTESWAINSSDYISNDELKVQISTRDNNNLTISDIHLTSNNSYLNESFSNEIPVINETQNCQMRWCYYANDTFGNMNVTSCQNPFTFYTDDATPPTYSKNSTNTTVAGYVTNFSLEWNDNLWLNNTGRWIFSTNNSGTWRNYTEYTGTSIHIPDISINLGYNSTKSLPSTSTPNDATLTIGDEAYNGVNVSDDNRLNFSSYSPNTVGHENYTHYRWAFNISKIPNYNVNFISSICYRVEGYYTSSSDFGGGQIKVKNMSAASNAWIDLNPISQNSPDANTTKCYTSSTYDLSQFINATDGTFQIATSAHSNRVNTADTTIVYLDYVGINVTMSAFAATPQNVSYALTLNSTIGNKIAWCYYAIDNAGNWNGTNCQSNQFIINTTDVTPPQWITGSNATNTTGAGVPCNFTLNWNDNYQLAGYIFSTNNSGTWVNGSYVTSFSGTSNTSWNVTTLNTTVGIKVSWCFYANDTYSNMNASSCSNPNTFIINTSDVTPPQWVTGSNATNTTEFGVKANFTLNWNDNYQLAGYIFSTNNSGTWVNGSYVTSFSGMSNTSWNITTLNTTVGIKVSWCFYANDTYGNMNATSCSNPNTFIVTITDTTPPTYSKNSTNNTVAGYMTNFSLEWNDNLWLNNTGRWIFSTNNSGTWRNYTAFSIFIPDSSTNKGYNSSYSITDSSPDSATNALDNSQYIKVSASDENKLAINANSKTSSNYTHYRWTFNVSKLLPGYDINAISNICYRVEGYHTGVSNSEGWIYTKNITGNWIDVNILGTVPDTNTTKCYGASYNLSRLINSTTGTFEIATSAYSFNGETITVHIDYIEINVTMNNDTRTLNFTATPQNVSYALTLNSTVGTKVAWCFYATDNVGNWNNSCSNPFILNTTADLTFKVTLPDESVTESSESGTSTSDEEFNTTVSTIANVSPRVIPTSYYQTSLISNFRVNNTGSVNENITMCINASLSSKITLFGTLTNNPFSSPSTIPACSAGLWIANSSLPVGSMDEFWIWTNFTSFFFGDDTARELYVNATQSGT